MLANPVVRSLLMITLLKGIDDYFAAISPQPSPYSVTDGMEDVQFRERNRGDLDHQEEEPKNVLGESTISISIKKKVRGKITL